jgi:hypothetical protein
MKNLIHALLFAKGLKIKKVSPRKITKSFKRETKLPITILSNLVQIIYLILKYVLTKLTKTTKQEICQEVVEIKDPNVVDFEEYRLKKAK